ncbi:brain protein I3 [Lates japonicus]|uniref:Membrane protein BRI3 n=1 Tax=Lates japonicus TaxID=270547 RepID=A0AAD3N5J4_LATJO|nr:brain protein I3 [Lates japonicus]
MVARPFRTDLRSQRCPGAYEYGPNPSRAMGPSRLRPLPPYLYPDGQGKQSLFMSRTIPISPDGPCHIPAALRWDLHHHPTSVCVSRPACRVGVLEDDFTCLGILCAIFFFPLGILFCFALRQRRCPNCDATFG